MLLHTILGNLCITLLAWQHALQEEARKLNNGQGLVEYALILVLVAVVVILVLALLGPALGNIFSNIVCGVMDAQNAACQ